MSATYNFPGLNRSSPDHPASVRISNGKSFGSMQISGVGAFGDVVTAELHPRIQHDFVYGGNDLLFNDLLSGAGAITYADGMAKCQSNGTGVARLTTKRVVKYRSGLGALFRFTGIFSDPLAGGEQLVGAFSCSTNALTVGYNKNYLVGGVPTASPFGFLRRHSGATEVHSLQVTVGAGGVETVTITLDGTAYTVGVTAGTAEETAQEIAEGTFAGWVAEATGDEVHFLSETAGPRAGAYSMSSTGVAAGTISQEVAGVVPTDVWAYKSDWNIDKLDGSGPSGMDINPQKLNVFAISLQYLGAGAIVLHVEDSETGAFIPVHRIKYANANTIPSVTNPTFNIGLCASGTADVWCKTASIAGFVEGKVVLLTPPHAVEYDGVVSAATPVISIRCGDIYHSGGSRVNLRDIVMGLLSVTATGSNKPVKARLVHNGTLTDPLWTSFDNGNSIAHTDTSATAITGGHILLAFSIGASTSPIPLNGQNIEIAPGGILSLVIDPPGTPADVVASQGWQEDL